MALKCVHQGCGKTYADGEEDGCNYHPGPPVFHEGQKGWKCCKPRVLTFEEFMSIPPCTQGRHSTTDLPPKIEKKEAPEDAPTLAAAAAQPPAVPRVPVASATATPPAEAPAPPPESEDDDPALEIPDGKTCRRRGCGATYKKGASREGEQCVHHPGVPIFHEGSKGYSCCKRRVLEFDQFMKIEGCATKGRHLFVGSGGKKKGAGANGAGDGEQLLESVRPADLPSVRRDTPTVHNHGGRCYARRGDAETTRLCCGKGAKHDYYQTATTVIASFFLKKIDKDRAKIIFNTQSISLDLPTADTTRYRTEVPLYAVVDPEKSTYKILGTKLEVNLVKADVASWPVLRSDERHTGEILQVGRAGSVAR